ncbi:MAG: gephyrin-like molybdotransferase Glp [Azonexus sp.]
MLSYEEAIDKLLSAAKPVEEIRHIPLAAATGRVLAAAVQSTISVPPCAMSAMDGYAVRAADVSAAGTSLPVSQRIPAGSVPVPLQPGSAARIFTGAPIPAGADTVVMQEVTTATDAGVTFNEVPRAGTFIRPTGEDFLAGGDILAAGIRLRPQDVALAAAAGLPQLPVFRRVRVGVFFTGDELVQPGDPLPPGGIYNSNRYALCALLESLGCEVRDLGAVPDDFEATRAALRRAAADNDLVVTSGGVSVGEEDHVKPAVEVEGQLQMWKLAAKPGKPLAFGTVRREAGGESWFIGLPGHPVSSIVTFMIFVRPFVLRLQGIADALPHGLNLPADFDWPKPDARREFLRARLSERGTVEIFPNQGPGVLSSLTWGTGLVDNPPKHAVKRGDLVRFIPFSELLS